MAWWQWILLGLTLSALELATPGGFYLIFFGVSAILVGLASLVGFLVPAWFEWLAFSVGSIVMLLMFRRRMMQLIQPGAGDVDSLIGETALPLETIRPGAIGRAEMRGTVWSARNAHDSELARGQRARVQRVDGLTLYLVPER
jgi:membrane protein implicated in regulation of membrane protease activity